MLYFGNTSMPVGDLDALRQSVKLLHSRLQRPLKGVEIGPWLGRSTLNILAPDLSIGNPNPFATVACDLMTLSYRDPKELSDAIKQKTQDFPSSYSLDIVEQILFNELSYLISPKKQYFCKFWCVDTWGGIASERNVYFRESSGTARHIFESNIAKAGFKEIVIPLQGESSCLASLTEKVDFVFIDADHEYDSVVKDLFAVRHLITPGTLLCGHDFGSDRWPGVELAVKDFVRGYITVSNVWIAAKEGIDFLLSLPPFEAFAERVESQQKELNKRFLDAAYRAKHHLVIG